MAKTVYMCEHCNALYDSRMDARWCEIQHEHRSHILQKNGAFLRELQLSYQNPCDFCQRAYFVYGVERNCECGPRCKDYNLFIGKEL